MSQCRQGYRTVKLSAPIVFVLLLGCAKEKQPDSYLPRLPEKPPIDRIAEIRAALADVQSSNGEARTVAAGRFYYKVRAYRGDFTEPIPEDLAPMGGEFLKVLNTLGASTVEDRYARRMIVLAIGLTGQTQPLLSIAEQETDAAMITALAEAFGTAQEKRSMDLLSRWSTAESPMVRKFATVNLAVLKDAAAVPALRARLADRVDDVKWSAAVGLAEFHKDRSGLDLLKKMLDRDYLKQHLDPKDPNVEVLTQQVILLAVRALRTLGDRGAIEPLRRCVLMDPSDRIKDACREAVRAIESPR
jgi:hypothetical protein